jgi:hypothetical protein
MSFRSQPLADSRKDGSVRELKEKEASYKGKQSDVFEKRSTAHPIGARRLMIGSATGLAEVNISPAYPQECP